MGKKSKKKKSNIDWDALVCTDEAGWQTGDAAMALDGDDDAAGLTGGGGGAAAAAAASGGGDSEMGGPTGGGKKSRKKGRGRVGSNGAKAMDTSDGGGRLGVQKGGGMKLSGKRGNRTAVQLKRKLVKAEKGMAFGEKLEARAGMKMNRRHKKAALKALY